MRRRRRPRQSDDPDTPKRLNMGLPPRKRPPSRFNRFDRKVFVIGGLFFLLLFGPSLATAMNGLIKPHTGCRIIGVTDGDTVRMICPVTGYEKGRILGYDTPEMKARCPSELFKAVAAGYYLRWTLLKAGKINALPRDRDRYGRRLVFVSVDDRPMSRVMINSGLARSYSGGKRFGWCS